MSKYMLTYDNETEQLFFFNNVESWRDKDVIAVMKKMNLVLEDNPVITFNSKKYYGWEDDYQIGIYMPKDIVIDYLCTVNMKIDKEVKKVTKLSPGKRTINGHEIFNSCFEFSDWVYNICTVLEENGWEDREVDFNGEVEIAFDIPEIIMNTVFGQVPNDEFVKICNDFTDVVNEWLEGEC